jgi:transcriptional regulator with XRE-family HTH domain
MKRFETVASLLGLTQNEVAIMLGIHRSQWSMYESGRRSLPLHAQERLAMLLSEMKAAESEKRKPEAQPGREEHLRYLLRENQYQRLLTARKAAAAERKAAGGQRLLRLTGILNAQSAGNKAGVTAQTSFDRVAKAAHASGNTAMKLAVKLEILEAERTFLELKLREIGS